MSKKIEEQIHAVYDYLCEGKIKELKKEGRVLPTCYAVTSTPKNDIAIMPIPLINLRSDSEMKFLLYEMSKLIKKENIKVKMFMIVSEAFMNKGDKKLSEDSEKMETLVLSARDCFDNENYQILKIEKKNGKVERLDPLDDIINEWKKIHPLKPNEVIKDSKIVAQDSLLDSIWKEYRSIK